jgi:hypothetical protein
LSGRWRSKEQSRMLFFNLTVINCLNLRINVVPWWESPISKYKIADKSSLHLFVGWHHISVVDDPICNHGHKSHHFITLVWTCGRGRYGEWVRDHILEHLH